MVCLGNICRSPMAEGIMQVLLDEQSIAGQVDSAGISDYHEGQHPDHRAINTSNEFGVDISRQVSRPISENDLHEFDFIFTMDTMVHDHILKKWQNHPGLSKVHLFLKFAGSVKGPDFNVPDPYYGGVLEFRSVFGILEKGCEKILDKIKAS